MPMSENFNVYKKIFEDEKGDPDVSIAALCRKYKVKYPNYNNWKKRYAHLQEGSAKPGTGAKKPLPPRPAPPTRPQDSVTVSIPLKDLIESYKGGKRTIVVNADKFINTLPERDRNLVLQELGKLVIAGAREKRGAVYAAPAEGDEEETYTSEDNGGDS